MEQQEHIGDQGGRTDQILRLIAALRGAGGCPWDRKQTPESLAVYLIEEVYELVEAITADDAGAIGEELGDVLFQIMFLVFLYQEQGRLDFEQVVAQNVKKMIRRHPHVFGTDKVETAGQVKQRWREIKQKEKDPSGSLMDSVPAGMPALMRAYRISERAAGIGFDWDNLEGVLSQTEAEWAEFRAELLASTDSRDSDPDDAKKMEFGDILFTLVNVARLARIHPETALIKATEKFIRRFKGMESLAAVRGHALEKVPRDEMERLWRAAKGQDALDEK